MRTFKEYVETANGAMNEEELFRIYLAAVARRGLDRGMFCLATHHDVCESVHVWTAPAAQG